MRRLNFSLALLLSLHATGAGSQARALTRPQVRATRVVAVSNARPLWPGARFTETERKRAIMRGLQFIYRTALDPVNFAGYGSDYLWCFYTLSAAVDDETVRRTAQRMGVERAHAWRKAHRTLPVDADAATISTYVFGSDAADSLGVRDAGMKRELRRAVHNFTARDYLLFDPQREPPPADVPDLCEYDKAENARGVRVCHLCQRPLKMRTRYDVWYDALIVAYVGERYGVAARRALRGRAALAADPAPLP